MGKESLVQEIECENGRLMLASYGSAKAWTTGGRFLLLYMMDYFAVEHT